MRKTAAGEREGWRWGGRRNQSKTKLKTALADTKRQKEKGHHDLAGKGEQGGENYSTRKKQNRNVARKTRKTKKVPLQSQKGKN